MSMGIGRGMLLALAFLLAGRESAATSDPATRESVIREGFQRGAAQPYQAVAADVKRLIRVDFDLSPQLLLPGEEVTLNIRVRSDAAPNRVFEIWKGCYDASPKVRTSNLEWTKNDLDASYIATWKWRPPGCGNYVVHWACDAGGDVPEFWRNFAVVDRGWAVMILNSTSHIKPRPEPDLHRLHLPFSYWAETTLYGAKPTAEDFAAFSRGARQFGDDPGLLVFMGGDYLPDDKTVFYDEPESVQRAVLECYRDLWTLCGFPRALDSLYTYGMGNGPARVARGVGITLLGALCADQNWGDGPFKINHWGMPARPYFVSEEDFRKPGRGGKTAQVAVQQCERQTVLCRDYGCVYAFESAIGYAFDQYSGITRPRIVNDVILSREMDFLEYFLNAAEQAREPYLFSCGIEFNGVWPAMADINRHFMEMLVRRAPSARLAFTTASAAADFMRRHYDRIPETALYLPDVFVGMTHGGKPPLVPDTMEIENASFRAIFRQTEALPYAQYDYMTTWNYPDWGNETIPRKPDGYVIPGTEDRFRATPSIVDTRPFAALTRMEERDNATVVTIEIVAEQPRANLALAVWDIPRTFTADMSRYSLNGAKRLVPVRAPYTGNLCGIVITDVIKGKNEIRLTITSPARKPSTIDIRINESVSAKVFDRTGSAIAYLFAEGPNPVEVRCEPPAGARVELYPFDSDEPRVFNGPSTIRIEPGKPQRLSGLSWAQVLAAFPGTKPAT